MAERKGFFSIDKIKEISKAKPGEEGALGSIDDYNRASYYLTKRATLATGIAALAFPVIAPAFLIAGGLAVTDKVQIEGSKWLRRKVKGGNLKQGQEVTLPKAA